MGDEAHARRPMTSQRGRHRRDACATFLPKPALVEAPSGGASALAGVAKTPSSRLAPAPGSTVKHWTFAGLLLTYWCNARCASCYVCSSPDCGGGACQGRNIGLGDMSVEAGLCLWQGLQQASPHGCRVHLSGGEPFGRWETLLALVRRAQAASLGPLEAVETNGFWATDDCVIRRRLGALSSAGMGRLTVSCDPYHQQFVPLERVRRLARVGLELLGSQRLRVRWRDWLADGFDTDRLSDQARRQVFAEYARRQRDRLTGRAAVELAGAGRSALTPADAFADMPCGQALLRSRHVHIDGDGRVWPGTCAGIILGRAATDETRLGAGAGSGAGGDSVGAIWGRLNGGHAEMDVIGPLARLGPGGLLAIARQRGFRADGRGYAGKCHLCWSVRRWFFQNGHFSERLGPANIYNL